MCMSCVRSYGKENGTLTKKQKQAKKVGKTRPEKTNCDWDMKKENKNSVKNGKEKGKYIYIISIQPEHKPLTNEVK